MPHWCGKAVTQVQRLDRVFRMTPIEAQVDLTRGTKIHVEPKYGEKQVFKAA